jgi:hypothetical protein
MPCKTQQIGATIRQSIDMFSWAREFKIQADAIASDAFLSVGPLS